MGIGVGLQASGFGTLVRAPYLRPAKEEALLRSEAVQIFWTRLPFQGFFIGGVGDRDAAKVTDALAQNKFSVLMQAGLDFVGVELFFDAGRALIEILAVLRGPPIAQVAFGVKLRTLIVKPMGNFMTDHGAHAAVVYSVVGLGIIKRRLQDDRGEDDFVNGGIVVSVDGGRRHAPLIAVDGLANFGKLAGILEGGGAPGVGQVG